MDFLTDDNFLFFVIIAIGYLFGRINIKGFSLGASAVMFVALVFGHYGVKIADSIQTIGLVLFLYTVGIQAGPGFFASFKKDGRRLAVLALGVMLSGGAIAWSLIAFLHIDSNIAVGLFAGAMTSTPGLAAAIDITGSPLASIGYTIAYPFGVIGVIVFVRLLPKMMKRDIQLAEKQFDEEAEMEHPQVIKRHYIVENENVDGKEICNLNIRQMTGAMISRIKHNDVAATVQAHTIIHTGDIIRAVGTEEAHEKIAQLIGPETQEKIDLSKNYAVRSLLVTNKDIINKSIPELNMLTAYNAVITRIRRAGIDIVPDSKVKLQMGDKIVVAARAVDMPAIVKIFGNSNKDLSDTDFLPIAIGIVLGYIIGHVAISMGDYAFQLGLTGGVLLVGLFLGRTGKTGPFVWTLSGAANQLLRQIGLIFFLAAVGVNAGNHIVESFHEYGIELFGYAAAITLLPLVLIVIVDRYWLKMNVLSFLGAVAGAMTSTPALAAVDPMTRTNAPHVAYATIYPIAMVLLIITVKILCIL
ncbi:MAG: aspartate:alanine exchanger family transporter [Salinivirgaceae bacterium]|jgi:putative transport protein